MIQHKFRSVRRHTNDRRRGSAAIELAVALPFIMTLVYGVIEVGRGLEVAQILSTAAREGARFGATDKQGYIPDGMTANAKIVQDVRNYLAASGIPANSTTIECVTIPASGGGSPQTFNFEDPANHLKEFRLNISVPYSAVSVVPPPVQKFLSPTHVITAHAVFRNYHK